MGLLTAVAGVALVAYGAPFVGDQPETAAAVPAVSIGPTGGSLTWRF
ncbi:MAG: hypothetical protein JRI55_19570 [Deltaproteobacteria bacterium]|nr:hypothetical protein [Deltaproteobacteria bacterium]